MTTPIQIHDHADDNKTLDRGFSERELFANLHDPVRFARIVDDLLYESALGDAVCADIPDAAQAIARELEEIISTSPTSYEGRRLIDSGSTYIRMEARKSGMLLGVAYEQFRQGLLALHEHLEREPNRYEERFLRDAHNLKAQLDSANRDTADAAD